MIISNLKSLDDGVISDQRRPLGLKGFGLVMLVGAIAEHIVLLIKRFSSTATTLVVMICFPGNNQLIICEQLMTQYIANLAILVPVNSMLMYFRIMIQESDASMETTFMLADTLYTKAKVPPTKNVCLWLGVSEACYCIQDSTVVVC
jgi:Prefoldin subunit